MVVVFQRGLWMVERGYPVQRRAYCTKTKHRDLPSPPQVKSAPSTSTVLRTSSGVGAAQGIYDKGHLAIVHAAGSPDNTRSHFDAQDYMEIGTPGIKSTPDGWLNRYLKEQKRVSRHSAE
jgi:hypothetical protein